MVYAIITSSTTQRNKTMTKSQLKAKLDKAIKANDKAVIMEMLSPLIEKLAGMIQAGVLIRNVKAHLSNNGITGKACEMIAEMAVIRADNFSGINAK